MKKEILSLPCFACFIYLFIYLLLRLSIYDRLLIKIDCLGVILTVFLRSLEIKDACPSFLGYITGFVSPPQKNNLFFFFLNLTKHLYFLL